MCLLSLSTIGVSCDLNFSKPWPVAVRSALSMATMKWKVGSLGEILAQTNITPWSNPPYTLTPVHWLQS
jgi:hypothetical protein